jgi:hypothetical protein
VTPTPDTTTDCGETESQLLALPLKHGSHGEQFHGECCLVEKSNRLAYCVPIFGKRYGKPKTFNDDHPSISRVVRAMAIGLNDMTWDSDDARTTALDRFAIAILGTKTTPADEQTRAWMATDWLVRTYTPAWLRLAGLTDEAQAIEGLARITDATLATVAMPPLTAAEAAARAAAARAAAATTLCRRPAGSTSVLPTRRTATRRGRCRRRGCCRPRRGTFPRIP